MILDLFTLHLLNLKNKFTRLIEKTTIDKIIIKQINPAAGLSINQLSVLLNR